MTSDPPRDLFPYFATFADLPDVLAAYEFFGNDHPVELDIGCGRGMFLVNASVAQPQTNYLGIELDYTEARRGIAGCKAQPARRPRDRRRREGVSLKRVRPLPSRSRTSIPRPVVKAQAQKAPAIHGRIR